MTSQLAATHHLSGKTILIAGAGVAGPAFAIALAKLWPSITTAEPPTLILYERDSAEDAIGREGYSLSLRSDPPGGIQALQKLGVLEAMIEASIQDVTTKNGGFCIWNRNWDPIMKVKAQVPEGLPVGGLRLARRNLRKVLIDATVETGCKIHWGVHCTGLSTGTDASSPISVMLSSGETVECDLVIAADGASSKLRAQLRPDDTLQFQKFIIMGGTAVYPIGTSPPSPIDCDWGLMPLGTKQTALFFSPVASNTALWSVSYRSDTPIEPSKQNNNGETVDLVLKEARDRVKNLPPLFYELLDRTNKNSVMIFNGRDKKPFGHDEICLPTEYAYDKVVFIGDANHAVTPFAGNGANMALCDGWELATQLLASSSVKEGVQRYDTVVLPQRNLVLKQSHIAIALAHSQGCTLWIWLMFMRILGVIFFNNGFYMIQDLLRKKTELS